MRKFTYIIERIDRLGKISYRAGDTDNLTIRIQEHLRGRVKSTKGYVISRIIFAFTRRRTDESDEISQSVVQHSRLEWKKDMFDKAFRKVHDHDDDDVWLPCYHRCDKCRGIGCGTKGMGSPVFHPQYGMPPNKPGDYWSIDCGGKGGFFYPTNKKN